MKAPAIIKDNSRITKDELSVVPSLVSALSDKTLVQLAKEGVFVFPAQVKESEDVTGDQFILQKINDAYYSSNVMGFLGYGEERLVIKSRFSRENNDFFFQFLLEKVMNFPNILNLESNAAHNDKMFMLLMFLFPSYLKAALRKGVFKMYTRKDYNDGNVKGTIDVERHIRKNIPFVGNIAYSKREHAYDNYLTQLIRHTIEYIKGKPHGRNLLVAVKDEVKLIYEATPTFASKNLKKVLTDNKKNTVRHAYYHEYRALQRLCILILQHEKHQLGIGSQKLYGILFDGAWLWEEYVNLLVKDRFYHPMNKGGKGAQWLFNCNSNRAGLIYPDFIGRSIDNRIIADAKYKPEKNIHGKDYLQVLAYMLRFEAKKAFYFYPESERKDDETFWLNRGLSFENNVSERNDICLVKHGLYIPKDAATYDEFVDKMHENEENFVEGLKCKQDVAND